MSHLPLVLSKPLLHLNSYLLATSYHRAIPNKETPIKALPERLTQYVASSETSYPWICREVLWLYMTLDKPKYIIELHISSMS